MSTEHRDKTREYWDADAATYDRSETHAPSAPLSRVAWATAIADLLPEPVYVLDVGAGTGFLTLPAARLGHRVVALDLSPRMLAEIEAKAAAEALDVETVEADATSVPDGPFDVVMSRHLLWALPDPIAALRAWRAVAPGGRLLLIDSMWGDADVGEQVRSTAATVLGKVRRSKPAHHAPYPDDLQSSLPLGSGIHPSALVELVEEAGWEGLRVRRLRDVEWALALSRDIPARLLGVHPVYAIAARNGERST